MKRTTNDDSAGDGGGDSHVVMAVMLQTVIFAFQHAAINSSRLFHDASISGILKVNGTLDLQPVVWYVTSCLILPAPIDVICSAALSVCPGFPLQTKGRCALLATVKELLKLATRGTVQLLSTATVLTFIRTPEPGPRLSS